MTPRLPHDADDRAQVWQYYATRARQLLHEGYQWCGDIWWVPGFEDRVFETGFVHRASGQGFVSYYGLPAARGQGYLRQLASRGFEIVTLKDCGIEAALQHVGATYRVAGRLTETREYQLIQDYYGDRKAQRSQVWLMNHIDEGLGVMSEVDASEEAMRAFCLHPLLQADDSLAANYARVAQAVGQEPQGAYVLGLAMEYRSVANEYLAHCTMRPGGIRLSPLKDVTDMLIGDKVQNRKDFEDHAATHANRVRLAEYFREWCEALDVADRYEALKALLPTN